MKLYCKEDSLIPFTLYNLTLGKWYNGELTPTMYDPQTLQPADPSYIVTCDDGKMRKVDAKHFITLEEWRGSQLDKVLS